MSSRFPVELSGGIAIAAVRKRMIGGFDWIDES